MDYKILAGLWAHDNTLEKRKFEMVVACYLSNGWKISYCETGRHHINMAATVQYVHLTNEVITSRRLCVICKQILDQNRQSSQGICCNCADIIHSNARSEISSNR